ncbi:MAG: hypothetical protein MUE61_18355 [Vicinamibacterales bacterium]|nr:hypothetical protein [Vicinamibacterales bacterium]
MNLHLLLLIGYSAGLLLLGLAVSRRVQSASGFFVANRQLSAACSPPTSGPARPLAPRASGTATD